MRSNSVSAVFQLIAIALGFAASDAAAADARFDVKAHGAIGDGVAMDTAALQKAIDACSAAGGGEVVFPKGRYLTGSLELKSRVHLVVTPEAIVVGSRSMADYPARRLIRATDAHDIAIEGGGAIDGQGETFWEKRGSHEGAAYRRTAQFEYRALKRPSFIHFLRCNDVTVRNITLRNSPSWTVHLQRCQKARIEKVTIRNPLYGPNTDGIDVNSCIDVLVRDCDIITGDDGVVLKSTEPGHDHPSRDITVEGCRIWSACNALKIGTETHDRFDNIVFRNCHLYCDSNRTCDRPLAGVAIESVDGSYLSGITVSDITMRNVRAPIFIRLGHRGGNSVKTRQVEPRVPGRIEKVVICNIKAERSLFESSITGIPGHPVTGICLENVRFEYEGGGSEDWILGTVPDETVIRKYPEAEMFGRLPAYGLYCRHAQGIELRDVKVSCLAPEGRPMLVCDDVGDLRLDRVDAASAQSKLPLMWFVNVRAAVVHQCVAPPGTKVFAAVEGNAAGRNGVRLEACDTSGAVKALEQYRPGELAESRLPLFRETSPGLFVVEAEALRLIAPMAAQADAASSSGRYISVPEKQPRDQGEACGRFQVTAPGDYVAWVRALGPSGEANSFYVSVDHGPPVLTDVEKLGVWYWVPVRNRTEGKSAVRVKYVVWLDVGVHTVEIRNRESGTKIDTIVIVRANMNFDPAKKLMGR